MMDGISGVVALLFMGIAVVWMAVFGWCAYKISSIWSRQPPSMATATGGPEQPPSQRGDHTTCAICLDAPTNPIITNCGHCYCAACVYSLMRQSDFGTHRACPTCRRRVNFLFSQQPLGDDAISREVRAFNRRYGPERRSMSEVVADAPELLRQFGASLFDPTNVSMLVKLRVILSFVLAALYAIMPFDVLPEAVLGIFGLADDALVFLVVAVTSANTIRQNFVQASQRAN